MGCEIFSRAISGVLLKSRADVALKMVSVVSVILTVSAGMCVCVSVCLASGLCRRGCFLCQTV